MQRIYIEDLIENSSYFSEGLEIVKATKPYFEKDEPVILDFLGCDGLTGQFLHGSFGELLNMYGVEKVKKTLKVTNIWRSQLENIKTYINNYK